MKKLFFVLLLVPLSSLAAIDLGLGTSNFTAGRPVVSLALGYEPNPDWGLLYRSEGVQTTIYAQNAWTAAWYKKISAETIGWSDATMGAGVGTTYILRSYRISKTADEKKQSEFVLGPLLLVKYKIGPMYIGFDTLLGLTTDVTQHIVLNFQDVSHVTFGVSL